MRKYLASLLVLLALACSPSLPAESVTQITAPDGYAIVCPTNFVRTVPHLCTVTVGALTAGSPASWGSCESWDLSGLIPSSTRYVWLELDPTIFSSNVALTLHFSNVQFYGQASCAGTVIQDVKTQITEQVAIAGTLQLLRASRYVPVPVVNSAVWFLASRNSTNQTLVLRVMGMFD